MLLWHLAGGTGKVVGIWESNNRLELLKLLDLNGLHFEYEDVGGALVLSWLSREQTLISNKNKCNLLIGARIPIYFYWELGLAKN